MKIDPAKLANEIAAQSADKGLVIAVGFAALRKIAIPAEATEAQVNDMRMAFYAGAQHLFASIMNILDPGHDTEPTDRDMARMTMIDQELRQWRDAMAKAASQQMHGGKTQ